jgi:hypothetical protein
MNAAAAPLADVVAEARRIVAAAGGQDLTLRVLGGAGVALHDHGAVPASLDRTYGDIDVVVPAKATRATTGTLAALGYVPNERFNALHGAKRMLFYDNGNGRQLDVFVGVFAMCHTLDLGRRLSRHTQALGAADLLLTKLQIAQINRKDVVDAVRIVMTHDLAETDTDDDDLSLQRLRGVTSSDWGWYTTFTDNLEMVRAAVPELLEPDIAGPVLFRLEAIRTAVDDAPKSMRWRARSIIGRKSPWFELPEEVDREALR